MVDWGSSAFGFALVFVAIEHEYSVKGRVVITERQDLVYKNLVVKNSRSRSADLNSEIVKIRLAPDIIYIDEVTMFRYSALTFNGHRIHYDRDYAKFEEGYSGLVVHGPLQATLLMNSAAQQCDGIPAHFSYRGIAPLIDKTPFRIKTNNSTNGGDVWCEDLTGNTTMQAKYSKA